jgi:hypothetical protein
MKPGHPCDRLIAKHNVFMFWLRKGSNMDLTYWLLTLWLLESMPRIKEGMTKQEVVSILGKPNGFQRSGEYETLRYTTHRGGQARKKTDFSVMLKDGRVVEYGTHYSERRGPSVTTAISVPVR